MTPARPPFPPERYLADLLNRTAWAPDCAIENAAGPRIERAMLHRIGHLWARAMLDDRFETLLLPVLVTEAPLMNALDRDSLQCNWGLSRAFFEERLESGACLLLFDGQLKEVACWPRNVRFVAEPAAKP